LHRVGSSAPTGLFDRQYRNCCKLWVGVLPFLLLVRHCRCRDVVVNGAYWSHRQLPPEGCLIFLQTTRPANSKYLQKIFTKPFFFLCFTNNTLYYSFPDFIFGGCLWIYGRIQSDNLTKESFLRRLLRSIAGAKGFANCKGNDNAKSQNH
jgi:hypothetical protein